MLATTNRGLEAKSGEMERNSAACASMVCPHCSDTSTRYSTAARRCASAVMLCGVFRDSLRNFRFTQIYQGHSGLPEYLRIIRVLMVLSAPTYPPGTALPPAGVPAP